MNAAITDDEKAGAALLGLIEYFRAATHVQQGTIDMMGLGITEQDAIDAGWLQPVMGPGRWDGECFIPAGRLREAVILARGSAVQNAWANYRERRAA
jgi:hypothetical protein